MLPPWPNPKKEKWNISQNMLAIILKYPCYNTVTELERAGGEAAACLQD